MKVVTSNKISDWKKKFFYFRTPRKQVPHKWRVSWNIDVLDERPEDLSTFFLLDNLSRAGVFVDDIVPFLGFSKIPLYNEPDLFWCSAVVRI